MKKNIEGLAERLKMLKNDLSATSFAAKCEIPQAMMDRYLKGENSPSAEKVIQICVACGCSSDWLLGLSSDSDNTNSFGNNTNPQRLNGMKRRIRVFKQKAELAAEQANAFLKTVEEIEGEL